MALVRRGRELVSKGVQVGAHGVEAAPEWVGHAAQSVQKSAGKMARAGLSPKRVVAKHRRRGHEVESLSDVRRLDLERVDAVRGRAAGWLYPAGAALSGAGAALVITGGELVTTASAGAATAPSVGAIAGAMAGDAAAVLALSSRIVGRTALLYGYDPEQPAEKLFIMAVVNAGSAVSAGAKTAAFADLSKLTQALIRGKSWAVLNESLIARLAGAFSKRFVGRLTKQALGKFVPTVGIVIGGALNWATLEGIADAADAAYRHRFLLEKYPELGEGDAFGVLDDPDDDLDGSDVRISVLDELAEEGITDL